MFGIGMTEIVVILVIALLIFGPNKLPELARSLGRSFGEFRRASYDLRQALVDAGEPEPPPRRRTPAGEPAGGIGGAASEAGAVAPAPPAGEGATAAGEAPPGGSEADPEAPRGGAERG